MSTSPIPFILDCDPGHDDALAIMLATASPEVELLGVTTVAGNTLMENATRNALIVLDMVNRTDTPVHSGSARPLVRELRTAASMHGDGGLDGPVPASPSRPANSTDALGFIENILSSATQPVTLVATGFIGLAAMIFGAWNPVGAFGAALIFGFSESFQQKLALINTPIPTEFLAMTPYLVTIIVVAGLVGRARPPAADG